MFPFMNAAGTCKSLEDVEKLARSAVTAITVGSITVKPRDGNSGNVFWTDPVTGTSLNSLGLPNGGLPYYEKHLSEMVKIAHDAGKQLRVSTAGFSPDEYVTLMLVAFDAGADEVEHNLGCPNVWGESGQKPIASFVPELVAKIIGAVGSSFLPGIGRMKQALKLSPYSDPFLLSKVTSPLVGKAWIDAVVTSNTFPNTLAFEDNKSVISVGEGLAGLGGSAMKHIALGQVFQIRMALDKVSSQGKFTDVIGVGGIRNGQDVLDMLHAGAAGVQVGTAYADGENLGVFSRILQEFSDLPGAEEYLEMAEV